MALVVTYQVSATDNKLSDEEKSGGWKLLFNGSDLSQWRNFKSDALSPKWQIQDGAVTLKVDDKVVVEGQTPGPMIDMPVDGLEVGVDRNGAVGRYPADKLFEGTVKNISLKILK